MKIVKGNVNDGKIPKKGAKNGKMFCDMPTKRGEANPCLEYLRRKSPSTIRLDRKTAVPRIALLAALRKWKIDWARAFIDALCTTKVSSTRIL
jgi:hypothetical protein